MPGQPGALPWLLPTPRAESAAAKGLEGRKARGPALGPWEGTFMMNSAYLRSRGIGVAQYAPGDWTPAP